MTDGRMLRRGPRVEPKDKFARHRQKLMAEGRCPICGKPPADGLRYCEVCREKRRRLGRKAYRRKRAKERTTDVGLSFSGFVKDGVLRCRALEKLAEIARDYPDLFTEAARSWLAERDVKGPDPGNGRSREPAAEVPGSEEETDPDVRLKAGRPSEVPDKMAAFIEQKGPLVASELASLIGCHGNSIHRAVRNDGRFVTEGGYIRLKTPEEAAQLLPNGFKELRRTGYDQLEELLKERGQLTPQEAADLTGYKRSYMEVAASHDTRFLRRNGHLTLSGRPKGVSLSSPEPSSTGGAKA